jgi:hypothetical protein
MFPSRLRAAGESALRGRHSTFLSTTEVEDEVEEEEVPPTNQVVLASGDLCKGPDIMSLSAFLTFTPREDIFMLHESTQSSSVL